VNFSTSYAEDDVAAIVAASQPFSTMTASPTLSFPLRRCGILAWGTSPGLDIVEDMLNYRVM
jgi:hypothetical protein